MFPPTTCTLWGALRTVADALSIRPRCWYVQGAFHFVVGGGRTIAVSAESAGRLRIDSCQDREVRATMWTRANDLPRLSQIVAELAMTLEEVA